MRSIYIQIKPSVPFWNVENIILSGENRKSRLIKVDSLSEDTISIIEKSIKAGDIRIFDSNNNEVFSIEKEIKTKEFEVKEERSEEDYILEPVVNCVTVPYDEEENEETAQDLEGYKEEAALVLEKNGNVIKKIIRSMSKSSEENMKLLSAMIEVETENKNRNGLIHAMKEKLDEWRE